MEAVSSEPEIITIVFFATRVKDEGGVVALPALPVLLLRRITLMHQIVQAMSWHGEITLPGK